MSPPPTLGIEPSPAAITLAWLVRLRWGAVVGQACTIAVVHFGLHVELPMAPLLALVLCTAVSNVALGAWLRRAPDVPMHLSGWVLGGDAVVLTALLYFSGGPSNPFSVLYLVHVTLAALVLGIRWAVAVVALSAVSYAGLFVWHVPIVAMDHAMHGGSAFSVHLQGMWIAFTVSGLLIAYFVARVAGALRERDAELAHAQRLAARAERLASLSTLAAGAAHELGTPLGTIAIASKELERSLERTPVEADDAVEDARLIRREVERCREIVQRMGARAGGAFGELPEPTSSAVLLARCKDRLGDAAATRVELDPGDGISVTVPREELVQVLVSLVQNGLQASRADAPVRVSARSGAGSVEFVVEDRGEGVPKPLLARVGEPFFTTKAPGEGMGLGLFLANAFADRWGGHLRFSSEEGQGTTVVLGLPRTEGGAHGV